MIIKESDGVYQDIDRLQALLTHPNADTRAKFQIEEQIRNLKAGERGEASAFYHIKTYFGASSNWVVLNDLRLEHDGMVAQIDHLLIGRLLDFWVCESKHVKNGIKINEFGEFVTFDQQNRPRGMASPIEQNERHIRVLRAVIEAGLVQLPTRLGMKLKPRFHSAVLISHGSISRPKAAVPGLETVIKTEHLRQRVDTVMDAASALVLTKLVGTDTLTAIGTQLAGLHRPIAFDWERRMGVGKVPVAAEPVPVPIALATPPAAAPKPVPAADAPQPLPAADAPQQVPAKAAATPRPASPCQRCGDPVSPGVKSYCVKNAEKFAGEILCMPCQAKMVAAKA